MFTNHGFSLRHREHGFISNAKFGLCSKTNLCAMIVELFIFSGPIFSIAVILHGFPRNDS